MSHDRFDPPLGLCTDDTVRTAFSGCIQMDGLVGVGNGGVDCTCEHVMLNDIY